MRSENPTSASTGGSRSRAWLAATRPKTLPAGIIPVLVGASLAYRDGAYAPLPALACLVGALLIQIGTNLANDYYDHRRGADPPDRLGPPRAVASGHLPPDHVRNAAFLSFATAALIGLYLVWVAGWPILVVGVVALLSGLAYTAGPYPLAYHGWGDAFVLVFFGLVATAGTYFVLAGPAPYHVLVTGAAIGCLATAILVVNNLRDLETDRRVGKRTLAVRLGAEGTRYEYAVLLLAAFLAPALLIERYGYPMGTALPLLALPLGFHLAFRIFAVAEPRQLNPLLARTGLLLVVYGGLLSVGVLV